MTFLEVYKKLDNLCKDMYSNDKGISVYIENMEQIPNAGNKIQGWDSAYKKLKHYRYIRNQIAHENYATEENMSNETDIEWIENFHRQILETNDPLAQYHKTSRVNKQRQTQTHIPVETCPINDPQKPSFKWRKLFYFAFAAIALLALIYLLLKTLQ